jgi:hypothetical protein
VQKRLHDLRRVQVDFAPEAKPEGTPEVERARPEAVPKANGGRGGPIRARTAYLRLNTLKPP